MTTKVRKAPEGAKKATEPLPAMTVLAFKGLDKDFACRGHKFEIGTTYTATGEIRACSNGFHACENPFDVWTYYGLIESRFALVELSGEMSRHGEDSKIAAASITIKLELTLSDFVRRAVQWVIDAGNKIIEETKGKGDDPSGYGAQIGSSGYGARIGSSGNDAQIGSSGYGARIGSSGYGAQIGSSGYGAQIGSSGNGAQIGSSGNGAQIGSSGNDAQIGSSGYDARIGSSGYGARIGSSGYGARIDSSGEKAVVASAGHNTLAKGKDGAWISLAEYDDNGACVGFATGCIGRDDLKPDVYYRARGGKLVEASL